MRVNLILQKCQFGLQSSGLEFVNTQVITQPMGKQGYGCRTCGNKTDGQYPRKVLMKVANLPGSFPGRITSKSNPWVTERKMMTTKFVRTAART